MDNNKTFNKNNMSELATTCKKINSLCQESVDGDLTYFQLTFLGDLIKDFRDNPIIKNSGLISVR
ncbi:hypothetical protein M0Q50_05755 [bacterium]|jgi:hypothetical protein|nr:hypothetical protein [bacterium]